MGEEYNSKAFTPKEVQAGLLADLLNYLLSYNQNPASESYYDIHITTDGYCMIVEWSSVDNDHQFGGTFQYIGEEQVIYTTYQLPDGSSIDLQSEDEFQEYFTQWMSVNPGWVKTSYGTWTNEIENKKFRKELENQEKQNNKLTKEEIVKSLLDDTM